MLYEEAFALLPSEGDAGQACQLLRWIGTLHRERDDLQLAGELYEASLMVAAASQLQEPSMQALNCLGVLAQLRGQLDTAERFYTEARALAEQLGDPRVGAATNQNLATLATIRGEVQSALQHYRWARESFRQLGDDLSAAWVLNNMGMGHVDLAEWGAAEACFDEAYELAARVADTSTLGSVELNRSELYLRRADFGRAREHCDQAFEIFTQLRSSSGLAEADKLYGSIYRDTAKPGLAETHFARAVASARAAPDPLLEAETLQESALLQWDLGKNREAFQSLNRAHAIFRELGARRELLDLNQRLSQIEQLYLRVVQGWGESIESKDRYTAGHCQRVADYACALAEAVGISDRDLTWFRMGAFLHDVGKIEVPEEVLNKPGKLTPEEWVSMQSHAAAGDRIVAELGFPWDIRPMVRSHHERWDGTGYPDGLRGEEIPLHARILCVADVYDALTTTRSYRSALSREEALAIMEADAGRLLDPELFRLFLEELPGLTSAPPAVAPRIRPADPAPVGTPVAAADL